MVTGAAGSIGSELCKQIVRYQPQKLICVDQAETPLFNLQQHILATANAEVIYSVADVKDTDRMRQLLLNYDVRVIFHAAAYKHVPMTELNPYEGLQNNVFGLMDLVEAAEECGCEDFLLISTDKAVNPSSLMGCTKRIGEMIIGSRETSQMRGVSVRFGNVLGSQGSVIPLFQEQIRTRRCVTVTHPQMTRYFMTIPEALMGHNMMRKDGEAHMSERQAMFPAVSPRTVRDSWSRQFQGHADRILEELAPAGRADLTKALALPLSAECLKDITGLTNMRYQDMDAWSQAMIDGIANYSGNKEVEARCHAATAGIDAAIDDMIPVVTKHPEHTPSSACCWRPASRSTACAPTSSWRSRAARTSRATPSQARSGRC